jgi:hypothetical protein
VSAVHSHAQLVWDEVRKASFPIRATQAKAVDDALESARVVGVLDHWGQRYHCDPPHPILQDDGTFVVHWFFVRDGIAIPREGIGSTPVAARAAAVKAIESGEAGW